MFHRLGRFTANHPWLICLAWLACGLLLALMAPQWETRTHDDDINFIPGRFTSVRAHQIMEQAFPQEVCGSRVIFGIERPDGRLTEADLSLVDGIVADLHDLRTTAPALKLKCIDSYKNGLVASRLISSDGQCTLIQVSLDFPFLAVGTIASVDRCQEIVRRQMANAKSLQWFTTGAACIGRDANKAAGESLEGTTLATVILVIVVLLAVYRAPLLALIPLAAIAISVWVSLNVLALLTLIPGVHLVNISKIFAVVMLYGAGTDYCLFLISRYRESLESGKDTSEALSESVGSVGHALAASAGTVMIGLALMGLAEFAKVRYAGPGIALSLGIALVASLTLTPALLSLFGAKVFWPARSPRPRSSMTFRLPKLGLWDWISHGVVKRPVLVWSVAVATLLPLALIGLRVQPNYKATGELALRCDSLQGLAAIQRHFTPGEIGPITVLLVSGADWNDRAGRLEIDHLSRGFASLDNVAEVRSLTRPLGSPLWDLTPKEDGSGLLHRLLVHFQPQIQSFQEDIMTAARAYYVAPLPGENNFVTRLDVVLRSDPFEPESHATLRLIQNWLDAERPKTPLVDAHVRAECFGVTPNAEDLATVTESDRQRINGLVILSIFLVLFALVRKVWLAAYLLVTVLLSYFAALGATLLAASLWTGQPLTTLDWRVPFFLFTILVAVGEDYNIMLIARAFQEAKKFGKVEGMRRALAKTGGAITSCGLIMAGTFATLMLAGLGTLLQVGFALAFGVLVDTFIVRPFLVPAFTLMVWKFLPAPKVEEIPEIDDDDLAYVEAA